MAAWLGIRKGAAPVVPTATATDAATAEQPRDKPEAIGSSTRRRDISRSRVNAETAINTKLSAPSEDRSALTAAQTETSVTEAGRVVNVTEAGTGSVQPSSNPNPPVVVAALPEDNFVYSSEGSGVTPPRLMSLGFPQPLVRGFDTRTSTLELVVSKSGMVERAKISSVSRNWEDAMLLSRAKSFQFVPAQRNGDPVRYRLFMNVETNP